MGLGIWAWCIGSKGEMEVVVGLAKFVLERRLRCMIQGLGGGSGYV